MKTKNTTIYLIRHGESEGNINGLFGLVPEASLTVKGIRQIENLSKKLSTIEFDCIFSSDLLRAKQTAEILAKGRNVVIRTEKGLRERSYGRLNGKTQQGIAEELEDCFDEYLKLSSKDKYYFKLVENMETVNEVVLRFVVVLRRVSKMYRGKTLLVVSHVTPIRGLLVNLGFVDYHEIDSSCIENAAYIKLENNGTDNFIVKETFGIRKLTS